MTLARTAALLALLIPFAPPAGAETLLRLAETAQVSVHPDELDAALRVEAEAPSAADAQARVNAAMERALAQTKQSAGIVATTGGYQVWPLAAPSKAWHAAQMLALHGGDGAALLGLVATLQGQGLAVQQLAWQLAPATRRRALAEATKQALVALRGRAEEAASVLGLRFDSFREVRLDGAAPAPMPRRAMAMAASVAVPAPSAEAADTVVEARVEADAVLMPIQPVR